MRTTIDINDALLSEAMAATGLSTKKSLVEEGLRTLVRLSQQKLAIDSLAGLGWVGDLEVVRTVDRA